MGGFFGSVQVRTTDRAAVKAAEGVAAARNIKCLIGPELNGWVVVYPEGSGQDETVGQQIAEHVGGYAIHLLVHDDDILAYWLWRMAGFWIDTIPRRDTSASRIVPKKNRWWVIQGNSGSCWMGPENETGENETGTELDIN